MDMKFKIGDRVIFTASMRYRSIKQAFEIDPGDTGTVSDTQYPSEWLVTVTLDKQPEKPITVPSDIVELMPEKKPEEVVEKHECCGDCADCWYEDEERLTPPSGFILLHDDASGEPVMYRGSTIDAIGDGYIVLKDGSEFDCEESIENIAGQIARGMEEGWMF